MPICIGWPEALDFAVTDFSSGGGIEATSTGTSNGARQATIAGGALGNVLEGMDCALLVAVSRTRCVAEGVAAKALKEIVNARVARSLWIM
ncbi:MAG: hypothetical protein WA190_05590 [Usitatibacter sp.]